MSGNAEALRALDERIAKLRTLPLALPEIARRVADESRRVIAANVAAQRGPDGKPWPATKDGHAALVNAMRSVDVRAIGTTIVISIEGVEWRHHVGATKDHVRRPIIPTTSIPQPIVDAIDRVVVDVLAKHMDGGAK